VILGERGNELEREIWHEFLPNKVVITAENAEENSELIPLLKEKKLVDDKPTVYVCENYVCQKPITSVEDLRAQF
jgi:uncharacterized protein YyaL (SSP411 family)